MNTTTGSRTFHPMVSGSFTCRFPLILIRHRIRFIRKCTLDLCLRLVVYPRPSLTYTEARVPSMCPVGHPTVQRSRSLVTASCNDSKQDEPGCPDSPEVRRVNEIYFPLCWKLS